MIRELSVEKKITIKFTANRMNKKERFQLYLLLFFQSLNSRKKFREKYQFLWIFLTLLFFFLLPVIQSADDGFFGNFSFSFFSLKRKIKITIVVEKLKIMVVIIIVIVVFVFVVVVDCQHQQLSGYCYYYYHHHQIGWLDFRQWKKSSIFCILRAKNHQHFILCVCVTPV